MKFKYPLNTRGVVVSREIENFLVFFLPIQKWAVERSQQKQPDVYDMYRLVK